MADNHDDELIAFERQVAHLRGQNPTVAVELVLDRCTTLYEQHDADQQQIAELRYFAEVFAYYHRAIFEPRNLGECYFCAGKGEHIAACPIMRARIWLAAHPR